MEYIDFMKKGVMLRVRISYEFEGQLKRLAKLERRDLSDLVRITLEDLLAYNAERLEAGLSIKLLPQLEAQGMTHTPSKPHKQTTKKRTS